MEIIIEKKEFKPRKGRIPKSKEYFLGSEINEKLDIGESCNVGFDLNEKSLSLRLLRIGEGREYSILKEDLGFRVYRTK